MLTGRRLKTFAGFARPTIAATMAALALLLTVFAASPQLHAWLHHGNNLGTDDGCAIVLFAAGVSVPLGSAPVVPPADEWRENPSAIVEEVLLASPRYLRQPERGPPVLG